VTSFALDAPPVATTSRAKAGCVIRLIAYILDNILLMLIMFVTGFGIGAAAGLTPLEVVDAAWQAMAFVALFYYISFWAMIGGTPGKLMLGLRVVGQDGGVDGIGWGRAFLRMFGYWLSNLILYLGFIWITIDKDKQGWHDKIAGTYVVHV
jgi:uncharacterized RDD family membrane protein YckC